MIDEAKLAVLTDEELARQRLRLHAACEARLREAELTITELGRRGATAVTEAREDE